MKLQLLATAIATALAPTAWALDFSLANANVDQAQLEKWECKRCTPAIGLTGFASAGAGYAESNDGHVANTTGVEDEGAVVRVDADLTKWDEDDTRYLLLAEQLGYDVARLAMEMERARDISALLRYELLGDWDIVGFTPFATRRSNTFTLPADWVTGTTTDQMPLLFDALRKVDTRIERQRLGFQLGKYFQTIRTFVDIQNDTRKGYKRGAGTILTNAVNLTERVDDYTTNFTGGLSVEGGPWQVAFSAYYSEYENELKSLIWQNPYTPGPGGATVGLQSVAPDNDAFGYQGIATWISGKHLISGQVAYGRHNQDQVLLPATITGPSPELPSTDGDLRQDKVDATLRYRLRVNGDLTVQLELDHEDRDFRTPLRSYPYVITDSIDAGSETPVNYDTEQQRYSAQVQYRFSRGIKGDLGYAFTHREWEEQAGDETDENHVWGKLRLNRWDNLGLWFELGYQDRELDNYDPEVEPTNDERLRPYHQADRENTYGKAVANYQFDNPLALQFTLEGNKAKYQDTDLGLDEVERIGGDLNLSWQGEMVHAYAFGNYYNIQTKQNGSPQSAGSWAGEQDDHTTVFGAGAKLPDLLDQTLTLGLDVVYAETEGDTEVRQSLKGDYSDYDSNRFTVDLYGRYHLSEASSLQLDLLYQDYDDSNYLNEGLLPSSINNVLILGDLSRDYSDYLMSVSYRHDF